MASRPPSDRKLFAGPRLRRVRAQLGLTQSRMADDLGVSVSYLNLIERNQRPMTAQFLLRLAETFDLDLRQLTDEGDDKLLYALSLCARSGTSANPDNSEKWDRLAVENERRLIDIDRLFTADGDN